MRHTKGSFGGDGFAVLCAVLAICGGGCSGGDRGSGKRGGEMQAAGASGSSAGSGGAGGGLVGTAASPSGPPTSFSGGMDAQPPTTPMEIDTIEPILIDDCGDPNPAGLTAEDAQRLKAGGAGAGRLLYPYDGTVFPRGMLPPTLMWEGAMADSVYVHIKSTHFEWHGCVEPTGPNQLELPAMIWDAASLRTLGTGDPYRIELSTSSAGTVSGPVAIEVTIAQATLKGSIYYNSYVSSGSFQGSIYRIPPAGRAEVFLGGLACYGCHTVSANGERLISHVGADPGLAYALEPTTMPNPPELTASPLSGFAGLSPDGTVYIGGAHPAGLVRPQGTPFEAALINDAGLYETDTGALLASGGIPAGAMMPTFSPDGTLIAFNDFAVAEGRGLVVMDFDKAMRAGSGPRTVFTDTDRYPGWPFFLPDNNAVIFARGTNPAFSGAGAGVIPGSGALGPESDLYIVDLDTGATTILAQAMGLATPEDTAGYVPFGADDLHKHYYPTVSPVSAGGYFWLFFDSIRNYGNLGHMRQLWGTAISISPDGDYSVDRSHPAFYLPGQELGTGNHRAFAALDACVADGEDCTTGIDCCGGFCFIEEDEDAEFGQPSKGTCTSQTPECSKHDERCSTDSDCCPPEPGKLADSCIAGFCAHIVVVE